MTSQRSFCPSDQRPGWMSLMSRIPLLRSRCLGRRAAASLRSSDPGFAHFSRRGAARDNSASQEMGDSPTPRPLKRDGRSLHSIKLLGGTPKYQEYEVRAGLVTPRACCSIGPDAFAGLDSDSPESRGSMGPAGEPPLVPSRRRRQTIWQRLPPGSLKKAVFISSLSTQGLGFRRRIPSARARPAWPARPRPRTPGGRPTAG